MAGYSGSITTSGTSEAIRLEKGLFRQHPEFRQQARVRAHVIAPGQLLVSLADDPMLEPEESDPVVEAFLAFLAEDLATHPDRVASIPEDLAARARRLTTNVQVDDNEPLPDDVGL